MKKLIMTLFVLIVLAVGGLATYISFMDWNNHKEQLASELSGILGVRIIVEGNLNGALFPQPHIEANQITIINNSNFEKLASIERMEMAVSLPSLLRGKPDIQSLALEGVEIWVNVDEKGLTNWHQNEKPKFLTSSFETRLQSFSLLNSVLHYSNYKYDSSIDLTNLNADIQAGSLSGPYRLDGNFVKDDDHFGMAFSIGSITQMDDIGLTFAITHPNSNSYLRYDGNYDLQNDTFKGDFSGSSEKTADFAKILLNKDVLPEEFNKPLMFSVNADVNEKEIKLSRLVLKFADYMEGSGDIIIPLNGSENNTASVVYQMVNFDFRPIYNILKAKFNNYQQGEKYEPDLNLNIAYDITSERFIVSDEPSGFFENVSLKGEWSNNAFNLDNFYAVAPGNMVITANGSITENNTELEYFANVNAEGQNFLSLLNALSVPITSPTQSSYRNVKLNFDLSGNSSQMKVENIKMLMDNMNASANVSTTFADKDYLIELKADHLNLDNYISRNEQSEQLEDWLKKFFNQIAFLHKYDLDMQFDAQEVLMGGIPMKNVSMKIFTENNAVKIDKGRIENVLYSKLNFDAILKNLDSENPEIEQLNFDLQSQNVKELANKWMLPLPKWPLFDQKNFTTQGDLSGGLEHIDLQIVAKGDDASFNYHGQIKKQDNVYSFDGKSGLKTTNFQRLAKNINLRLPEDNDYRSPFNGKWKINGNYDNLNFEDIEIQLGSAKYNGSASFKKIEGNHKVFGSFKTNDFNLSTVLFMQKSKGIPRRDSLANDNFIPHPNLSKEKFDFAMYEDMPFDITLDAEKANYGDSKAENLHVRVNNEFKLIKILDLSLKNADMSAEGNFLIDFVQKPTLSGKFEIKNYPIKNWGGSIYNIDVDALDMHGNFISPFTSFDDLLSGISGNVEYSANGINIVGINLAAIEKDLQTRKYSKGLYKLVNDKLRSGETNFATMKGKSAMQSGIIEVDDSIFENEISTMLAYGKLSLGDWKMNMNFEVKNKNLKDLPIYAFTLSNSINNPTVEANVEELATLYDNHWDEIKQAEEEKEKAKQQVLAEKMEQAKIKLAEIEVSYKKSLQNLDKYISRTTLPSSMALYNVEKENLNEVKSDIENLENKVKQEKYTENDIKLITDKSAELKDDIAKITKKYEDIYLNDVKQRRIECMNVAKRQETGADKLMEEYKQMVDEDINALQKLSAMQYYINNPQIQKLNSSINEGYDILKQNYADFKEKYAIAENIPLTEAEPVIAELTQINSLMAEFTERLNDMRSQAANLLLDLINERQKLYGEEQEKIAAEREMNRDNLLAQYEEPTPDEKPQEIFTEINKEPENTSVMPENIPVTQPEEITPPLQESSEPLKKVEPEVSDVQVEIRQLVDMPTSETKEENIEKVKSSAFTLQPQTSIPQQETAPTPTITPIVATPQKALENNNPVQTIIPQAASKPVSLLKRIDDSEQISTIVKGKIITSYDKQMAEKNANNGSAVNDNTTGSGLLRNVDGAVQAPSGTITVK